MMLLVALVAMVTSVQAQAWGDVLRRRVSDAAKRTVEERVEREVEKTIDGAIDEAVDGTRKARNNNQQKDDGAEAVDNTQKQKTPEAVGQERKSDFVPGTVVIFEDNLANEQLGEFPSKWDLLENNAEVAKMNGKMAIKFEHGSDTEITPLLEDENKKYLPEVYTLELDFFVTGEEDHTSGYHLFLSSADNEYRSEIVFGRDGMNWDVVRPSGDDAVEGSVNFESAIKKNDWNHFALSFNKRALKAYVNDRRYINIPNAKAADWFSLRTEFWEDHIDYITNIRLAKGAVALYDRNAQSMTAVEKAIAETGKFVTNNILFETGKATHKPESMEEIQKVADYMKKNPTVRFEVQGHTDNQGTDAINDPLSQQRAEAVVPALENLGCDGFNLRAVGKGSHEPVADNKTDEGRAKNRRVEFIKK